jgi:hypothetical protein
VSDVTLKIKLNKTMLNKLIRELTRKSFIEIGIFDSTRNATIGWKHEFGIGVPQRSFMIFPLLFKGDSILSFYTTTDKHFKTIIDKGLDFWINLVLLSCTNIISEAFSTGGFGSWKPLSLNTINRKKTTTILVDTGEMFRAITGKIIKKSN